ncbi:MAG: hypothetical protein QT00_C0001G0102 [archaeon GW2011_AR5]|nr:MAG: hypothetical protein QT00_C0001G0102 [archaeon GW2011_AR5]
MMQWQCMTCANKIEAEEAPEECPRCKSQMSFSQVRDWRFF